MIFTSTQLVNVLKQKSMKKRLCCLVQVVWTPEVIKKKYLDPPKDMDNYLLIDGRDKLKFESKYFLQIYFFTTNISL